MEPVEKESLRAAMDSLFGVYFERNGTMPKRVVIYRDGVGDNQFDDVVQSELGAIRESISSRGYSCESVQITLVICQKNHNTRFFYESSDGKYENVCPGLCTDARNAHINKDGCVVTFTNINLLKCNA